MAAFASPANLLVRYDYRVIGQLISDNGTAENSAAVSSDPITTAMLEDASGLIIMYALKGGRYTEADLAGLTGNAQAFLVRLTCDLALYNFVLRRGLPVDQYPQVEEALKILDDLAKGDIIFPIPAVIAAGVAQSPAVTIETIAANNMLIDSVAYFPTRRWTLGQLN